MMNGFSDIVVTWQGAEYRIPAGQMMPIIAEIEDILERGDNRFAMQVLISNKGPSLSKLAMCYAALLRHAGAAVTSEEVYLLLQQSIAEGDGTALMHTARDYAMTLLATISPPLGVAIQEAEDGGGKPAAAGS